MESDLSFKGTIVTSRGQNQDLSLFGQIRDLWFIASVFNLQRDHHNTPIEWEKSEHVTGLVQTIAEKMPVTPRVAESFPAKVCYDGQRFYVLNLTVPSFSGDWEQAL